MDLFSKPSSPIKECSFLVGAGFSISFVAEPELEPEREGRVKGGLVEI